jgi:hypothetical protein
MFDTWLDFLGTAKVLTEDKGTKFKKRLDLKILVGKEIC